LCDEFWLATLKNDAGEIRQVELTDERTPRGWRAFRVNLLDEFANPTLAVRYCEDIPV
jgi:hypothetical protein